MKAAEVLRLRAEAKKSNHYSSGSRLRRAIEAAVRL